MGPFFSYVTDSGNVNINKRQKRNPSSRRQDLGIRSVEFNEQALKNNCLP